MRRLLSPTVPKVIALIAVVALVAGCGLAPVALALAPRPGDGDGGGATAQRVKSASPPQDHGYFVAPWIFIDLSWC